MNNAVSYSDASNIPAGFFAIFAAFQLFALVIGVILLISMWKIFTKAGKPGWACLIPIYNMIVMLQMIKKPEWWVILMFIPFVNIIVGLIVLVQLAKTFGKGIGFTLGLIFLPFIFYPILGFGKSVYMAPTVA